MLKIKQNCDLKELEKFGFVRFVDKEDGAKANMGTENGYELDFGNTTCRIVESRSNWKWLGGYREIREIGFEPNDYELFIGKSELDLLFDLIQANLVEKVEENLNG